MRPNLKFRKPTRFFCSCTAALLIALVVPNFALAEGSLDLAAILAADSTGFSHAHYDPSDGEMMFFPTNGESDISVVTAGVLASIADITAGAGFADLLDTTNWPNSVTYASLTNFENTTHDGGIVLQPGQMPFDGTSDTFVVFMDSVPVPVVNVPKPSSAVLIVVPEPSSAVLIVLALVGLLAHGHRRRRA